ncbi:glycosyltransferase [Bilophila wadsworthia]|nr:glycosyltransferase [Bilophila wadsworthia]MCB8571923.1 glycosyltransferase [Bilophila wadsworthia]MCG4633355.1 glycosyltransferase [Bilophila wadsworthia]
MFLKKDINILTRKHEIIDDLYIQIANSHDVKNELTRLDYLISCVRGKRVLHIGCCDHLSLIDTKIANGTWLHGIFLQEAASCFGIDIDKDAIMYLTKKKYKNIYVADVMCDLPKAIKQEHFDVVVLGEILEHLDSPGVFLQKLHSHFDYQYELVITVPNAFFWENFKNCINHFERINSDHRFWFTPYTICKLLSGGGYVPQQVSYAYRTDPEGYGVGNVFERNLYRDYPAFRDVLVIKGVSQLESSMESVQQCLPISLEEVETLIEESPEAAGRKQSLTRTALVELAGNSNLPVYDETIGNLLRDMRYWHEKYSKKVADAQFLVGLRKTEKPFFSVVVPVFQTEEFLPTCLNSLLNQSYKNFEVIVVNDASDGPVEDILDRYTGLLNIRYWKQECNSSLLQARKKGTELASGAYVVPLDSDDSVEPLLLEKYYEAIIQSQTPPDWLSCHIWRRSPKGDTPYWANYKAGIYDRKIVFNETLSNKIFWNMCGKCLRKDLLMQTFEALHIDDSVYINSFEDKLQFIPFVFFADKYHSLDYFGYNYVENSLSLSSNIMSPERWKDVFAQCKDVDERLDTFCRRQGILQDDHNRICQLSFSTIVWALSQIESLQGDEYAAYFKVLADTFDHACLFGVFFDKYLHHRQDLDFSSTHFPTKTITKIQTIGFIVGTMRHGGAERATALLVSQFVQRGYRCVLLTNEPEQREDYAYEMSVTRYVLPIDSTCDRYRAIGKILQDESLDCVLLIDHVYYLFDMDILACKDAGVKTIVTEHNCFFYPFYNAPQNYLARLPFYKIVDVITCLSSYNEAWWHIIGFKHAFYLPNLLTINSKSECFADLTSHQLVFSGRLCAIKGIAHAIQMMRQLVMMVPDAVLNVLGRFESQQLECETRQMVKQYGLEEHIRFHGHVADIIPFYLNSSIHIMCSKVEGAPMVLFEAKACKMPSVIFSMPYVDGTTPEEGCLSVPQGDVQGMAKTIADLLTHPEKHQALAQSALASLENFSDARILEKWRTVLACLEKGEAPKTGMSIEPAIMFQNTMNELQQFMRHLQSNWEQSDQQKGHVHYLSSELTRITGHAQYLSSALLPYEQSRYYRCCRIIYDKLSFGILLAKRLRLAVYGLCKKGK